MDFKLNDQPTQAQWDKFVTRRTEANFLQSWQYGEFYNLLGRRIYRRIYSKNGKPVGAMMALVEPALRARYISVAGGPLLDWEDDELVKFWRLDLYNIAIEEQAVFVRVRPQLIDDGSSRLQFSKLGFFPAPMHLSAELTSQLDLTKSEAELLAGMRRQTRYAIRQAQKQDLRVTISTDRADIAKFYELQLDTAQRQSFVPFSEKFLELQFAQFAKDDQVQLLSAYHGDELLAQAFVIYYGREAAYHYGASTELGRTYPGAYLLQWRAICEAKARGLARYNFWGVAPAGETKHRFSGVSTFKRGFGGTDVAYLHAHDLVIKQSRYLFNWAIEQLRRFKRHV